MNEVRDGTRKQMYTVCECTRNNVCLFIKILLNMIDFGMNPQEALDQPRFRVQLTNNDTVVGNNILLEQGISEKEGDGLRGLGYNVKSGQTFENFGKGQIIHQQLSKESKQRVYWAGSDPRGDGMAVGF